jgi:hypothetical protein
MTPNITTWGGGVIYDGTKHHLFVSRMTNSCPLQNWGSNSRIDHAISTTGPEGPYYFADVAVNTWAHNAAPIQLPDGSFAIIHIGTGTGGPNGGKNCTDSSKTFTDDVEFDLDARLDHDALESSLASGGSTIHVSKSLSGPWTPLQTTLGRCNNPAPWVHPNGTIYVGCGGALKSATSLQGPFITVGNFPTGGGPVGNYEDPQIYTDRRGNFHCLYHVYTTNFPSFYCVNSTVAAHAFSLNGVDWHISKTSPYGTQVQLETGQTITVATRERPKPYFENGKMTHLMNGVCGSPMCATPKTHAGCVDCKYAQWDYTLAAPLDI